MKAGGGALKGSAWERKFCKVLSEWWEPKGKDKYIFVRTRGSGSLGTVSKVKQQLGDVCATDHRGVPLMELVVIELKSVRDAKLSALLERTNIKKHPIIKWWDKVCGEAKSVGKFPLLVIKQNLREVLVVVSMDFVIFYSFGNWVKPNALFKVNGMQFMVCSLSNFFKYMDPTTLSNKRKKMLESVKSVYEDKVKYETMTG